MTNIWQMVGMFAAAQSVAWFRVYVWRAGVGTWIWSSTDQRGAAFSRIAELYPAVI